MRCIVVYVLYIRACMDGRMYVCMHACMHACMHIFSMLCCCTMKQPTPCAHSNVHLILGVDMYVYVYIDKTYTHTQCLCVSVSAHVCCQDEDQAFWALLLPESEMRAVERISAGIASNSDNSVSAFCRRQAKKREQKPRDRE